MLSRSKSRCQNNLEENMSNEFSIQIRVRYCETDAMGCLHHSQFFNYFEQGRTEMLRAQGGNYREIEEAGLFLVVVRLQCSSETI